jgi:hypothetical protein
MSGKFGDGVVAERPRYLINTDRVSGSSGHWKPTQAA